MRQAITTKYLGPTNSRGSRIKAIARKASSLGKEMSLTDAWDHGSNPDGNHCRVAQLLATKLGWSGLWVAGGLPTEDGNCYVNICEHYEGNMRESFGREGSDWFYVSPSEKDA